ncbi:hypothetical protein L3V82_11845 [Thiotrichales bacterium 19S3-7]|nr:hypothetical protein [Thiotrichales bacterium 19S3-7]MCF6802906.1 hypothetical protein [Thiotrichales bacterium 19S3-11]
MPKLRRPNFTTEQKKSFKEKLNSIDVLDPTGPIHNCHHIAYARIRDKIFAFVDGQISENELIEKFIKGQLYPKGISEDKLNFIINLINNVLEEKPNAIYNLVKELNSSDQNLRPGYGKENMSIGSHDDPHIVQINNDKYRFETPTKTVMHNSTPDPNRLKIVQEKKDQKYLKTSSYGEDGKPLAQVPLSKFTPNSKKHIAYLTGEPTSPFINSTITGRKKQKLRSSLPASPYQPPRQKSAIPKPRSPIHKTKQQPTAVFQAQGETKHTHTHNLRSGKTYGY